MRESVKNKIIVIVGPTASGKSELAVDLAKRFNGEIISADSRQIYRRLDIGTGKVRGHWKFSRVHKKKIFFYKGIPHHLIDIISPKKQCTAHHFVHMAKRTIADIAARRKIPIIAGGTGFWIDALVYGTQIPHVPPNESLRRILKKKNTQELFLLLQKMDPRRAKTIDAHNPHRLIRAIEIAHALGAIPPQKKRRLLYDALWLGIKVPQSDLCVKIKIRLDKRMHGGIIREAKKLKKGGLLWKRFYELGLEYRFLADMLQKKLSQKEAHEKLCHAIVHYAKRQMTWWKKNQKITWISKKENVVSLVKNFLR